MGNHSQIASYQLGGHYLEYHGGSIVIVSVPIIDVMVWAIFKILRPESKYRQLEY